MNNQSLNPAIRVKAFLSKVAVLSGKSRYNFAKLVGQFRQNLAKSIKLLFISFYADRLSLFKLLFFLEKLTEGDPSTAFEALEGSRNPKFVAG